MPNGSTLAAAPPSESLHGNFHHLQLRKLARRGQFCAPFRPGAAFCARHAITECISHDPPLFCGEAQRCDRGRGQLAVLSRLTSLPLIMRNVESQKNFARTSPGSLPILARSVKISFLCGARSQRLLKTISPQIVLRPMGIPLLFPPTATLTARQRSSSHLLLCPFVSLNRSCSTHRST